jgi:hypothetical protein
MTEEFGKVIMKRNYTVWACAILKNHAHFVIRKHRDDALTMWTVFADATRLRERLKTAANHPVWSSRPFKVFLYAPADVRARTTYVERNPPKEGLPPQRFEFVRPYNSWPFHKR